MLAACGATVAPEENPAAQLGALLAASAEVGRDKLTLVCSAATERFGAWAEQLVAESLGKAGRGLAPIIGEHHRDVSAYADDRLFVEVQLERKTDAAVDRQVQALMQAGYPVIRIRWDDRYDLGGEVAKWSMAVAFAAHLMGVNPFDEPNVDESKERTKVLLARYTRERELPQEPALASEESIEAYGTLRTTTQQSLTRSLSTFFEGVRPTDYVAVLSFLPRTPELDKTVKTVRGLLGERLGRATMLGLGPRYLHSTGQLYKGGPDAGIFLLLTADETQDLPIPGEPYTFGVLKQAQALGDFQAMQEKGRRVLRLHLRGKPQRVAHQLVTVLDEATKSAAAH
jgi:hypothetical protein